MLELNVDALLQVMGNIVNTRTFKETPLLLEDQETLFKAFAYGPSSTGNQARELLIAEDQLVREKLIKATLSPYFIKEQSNQAWLKTIPFLAVAVIEKRRAIARVGDVGVKISERESENSLQNMRLVADLLGIGTTVVREFDKEELQRQLSLPWYVEPVSIIAAGYKIQEKSYDNILRFNFEQIIHKDRWS